MLKLKDLYTQCKEQEISLPGSSVVYGKTIIQYEIREYTDVRNLSDTKKYIINCTQRLIIPNQAVYNISTYDQSSFKDYPALIINKISMNEIDGSAAPAAADCDLLEYSPRTLNTAVMTDRTGSESQGSASSKDHTTGSSTSQTNSYGFSENIGFMGDIPTGGVSSNQEFSTTHMHDHSDTRGSSDHYDQQNAHSDSMSIKDWGSYAVINNQNQSPTWVWGQEYPWDVVQFRSDSSGDVTLPEFIQQRLLVDKTNKIVAPPTQLSLFGVDFVSKASWVVSLKSSTGKIQFEHDLSYAQGSHSTDGKSLKVSYSVIFDSAEKEDKFSVISDPLDLPLLALDPVTRLGSNNGAVIGFIPDKFEVQPAKGANYEIASASNNLLARGGGFPQAMSTDFSDGPVQMDIYFKIIDPDLDFTLFMKCWKTQAIGVTLNIVFNGDKDNSIVKLVGSKEAEGGEENLISIIMRTNDYTSLDYHDYLQMGLNHISITITPDGTPSSYDLCGFEVRALAIG